MRDNSSGYGDALGRAFNAPKVYSIETAHSEAAGLETIRLGDPTTGGHGSGSDPEATRRRTLANAKKLPDAST